MIERLDVQLDVAAKFGERRVGKLYMPAHREIRAIDLENETGA